MPILGSFGGARGFGRSGTTKPLPPTINSVTDVGTSRAFNNGALSISVTPNAIGPTPDFYNFWAVAPDTSEIAGSSTSSTTLVVGSLASNTQYTVKVVAVVNNVASDFATFNTPTLVTTVPAAPTIGTATDVGTSRSIDNAAANVTFTAGATGGKSQTFKVYTSNGTQRGSGSSSPILAEGINIGSFGDGSSQSFRVRGVNSNGESQQSGDTSAITLTSTPGATTIVIDSISGSVVSFTYNASETGGKTVTSVRFYAMSNGSELVTKTVSSASGTDSLTLPNVSGTATIYAVATNSNGVGTATAAGSPVYGSQAATLSPARVDSSTGTVTIDNYNAAYTYTVTTTSGSASRTNGTITITGAGTDAFNVTVKVNQGSGYVDTSTTATVPAFVAPPFFPPYFPIVLGRCTSAQVVMGCFSTSACCDGGLGEECFSATSGCDF
jgi:hypothetical protein